MKLTDKETAFLLKFAANDIVRDHGWESPEASAWTADLCNSRSDAAVLGSLIGKRLMNGNGESVRLTDAGRAALAQIKKG
jgi:hypothetical protein